VTFTFVCFLQWFLFACIDEPILHTLSPVASILLAFFKVDNDFFTSSFGDNNVPRTLPAAGRRLMSATWRSAAGSRLRADVLY